MPPHSKDLMMFFLVIHFGFQMVNMDGNLGYNGAQNASILSQQWWDGYDYCEQAWELVLAKP
jgi:hypothetical protein